MDYATIADVYDVDALDYIKQVPLSDEYLIVVVRHAIVYFAWYAGYLPGGFTTITNCFRDR